VTESSFAGSSNELWCEGGEVRFITSMIEESTSFSDQVGWFTVLVSKGKHLEAITHKIEEVGAVGKVFSIQRGQKVRRVVGWCF